MLSYAVQSSACFFKCGRFAAQDLRFVKGAEIGKLVGPSVHLHSPLQCRFLMSPHWWLSFLWLKEPHLPALPIWQTRWHPLMHTWSQLLEHLRISWRRMAQIRRAIRQKLWRPSRICLRSTWKAMFWQTSTRAFKPSKIPKWNLWSVVRPMRSQIQLDSQVLHCFKPTAPLGMRSISRPTANARRELKI